MTYSVLKVPLNPNQPTRRAIARTLQQKDRRAILDSHVCSVTFARLTGADLASFESCPEKNVEQTWEDLSMRCKEFEYFLRTFLRMYVQNETI